MRLERFTPGEQKPIGTGKTKEVFANPSKEGEVISVMKAEQHQDSDIYAPDGSRPPVFIGNELYDDYSPRQLKGAFYLTKVAHLLFPQNVPDIHQVNATTDGQQTIDRDMVAHTAGQAAFQAQRAADKATYGAENKMHKEMGAKKEPLEAELKRVGLDRGFAAHLSNYSKDADGQISYLPEFKPWEYTYRKTGEITLAFNEEALRESIAQVQDPDVRKHCETYLERLLALFSEEQKNNAENPPNPSYSEEIFNRLNDEFNDVESEVDIKALFLLTTEEEALASAPRELVRKQSLPRILVLLRAIETIGIPTEPYLGLDARYRRLARAVGSVNGGVVDHTR
ncbi:MAG: hypothetical protein AAB921_00580 [Patescibacteria group bacterium]